MNNPEKEITLLIMDHLYKKKHIDTLITLEKETSLSIFNYNKEILFLKKLILDAQWSEAENYLSPLRNKEGFNYNDSIFLIKKQKIIEMIESEDELDQKLLEKEIKCMTPYAETKEKMNGIFQILSLNSVKELKSYANWTQISGRFNTFEKIREYMKVVYPPINERKIQENILNDLLLKIVGNDNYAKGNVIQPLINFLSKQTPLMKRNNNYNDQSSIMQNNESNHQISINTNPVSSSNSRIREKLLDRRPKSSKVTVNSKKIDSEKKTLPAPLKEEIKENILQPSMAPLTITCHNSDSPYSKYSYDPSSFNLESLVVDTQTIRTCCFNPKGDFLALGTNSKSLKIFSLSPIISKFRDNTPNKNISLQCVFEKQNHHLGSLYTINWSPNNKLIASGGNDKIIKIIVAPELENMTEQNNTSYPKEILELKIEGHKGIIRSVLFSPKDSRTLLSCGDVDQDVFVWDTDEGKLKSTLRGHIDNVHSIKACTIPVNDIFCSCDKKKNMLFWDLRANKSINILNCAKFDEITDVSFTASVAASGHKNGMIAIWDYSNKQVIKEINTEPTNEIRSINFSIDGKFLIAGGFDKKIRIYDVQNDFSLIRQLDHDDKVVCCNWHPEIPIIASTSTDKTARIWIPTVY